MVKLESFLGVNLAKEIGLYQFVGLRSQIKSEMPRSLEVHSRPECCVRTAPQSYQTVTFELTFFPQAISVLTLYGDFTKEVFISSSAEAHPAVPRLKSGGRDALTLRGLLHHPFLLPSCAFPSLKTVLALQSLVFSAERGWVQIALLPQSRTRFGIAKTLRVPQILAGPVVVHPDRLGVLRGPGGGPGRLSPCGRRGCSDIFDEGACCVTAWGSMLAW